MELTNEQLDAIAKNAEVSLDFVAKDIKRGCRKSKFFLTLN